MSSFGVVLDACVLIPACLRDTLLRSAAAGLYRLHWSIDILAEVERNLIENGLTDPPRARELIDAMRNAFPEADTGGYRTLIPSMTNNEKDRHVVAVALVAGAQTIVTFNVRDFPEEALAPYGIEAQHPDEFLEHLFDLRAELMESIVVQQAAATKHPPLSVEDILNTLDRDAPRFVRLVRDHRRNAAADGLSSF